MRLRSKIAVGIAIVTYAVLSAVVLIMNGGGHLTHDQLVGWLR